jgi:hypothetical protein
VRFLSDPVGIIEHMFGVVVDRFETVFDPDDGFDWFELTLAEALDAQMSGWEIDDRARLLPSDPGPLPTSQDLMVTGLLPTNSDGWKSVDGAVARLDTWWRLVSHMQARTFQATWRVVEAYRELGVGAGEELWENVSTELRAALNLTRCSADRQVELAHSLVVRLPMVLDALGTGRIDLRRAIVLVDQTSGLSEEDARRVCDRVMERAERLTTGQLRGLVQRLCLELDPDSVLIRQRDEVEERRVWAELSDAGTAEINGCGLDPIRVAKAMDRIDGLARSLRTGGEVRTIDQLRADVFLDLLEGNGTVSGRRGVVDIRVELTTLLGLDRKCVELAGFGPLVDDVVSRLDVSDRWQMTVTDSGQVIDSVVTRRRPTKGIRRRVEARDQTCVFPGCRMPASACDLDHRLPYSEGGLTHPDQMVALCRHDHVVRHQAGWTHRPEPGGGHTWVSPLGNTYTRPPP